MACGFEKHGWPASTWPQPVASPLSAHQRAVPAGPRRGRNLMSPARHAPGRRPRGVWRGAGARTSLFAPLGFAVLLVVGAGALGNGTTEAVASSAPCGNGTFSSSPLSCTYTTVGSDSFTVPNGVTRVTIDVFGAQGGWSVCGAGCNTYLGGLGGEAKATLVVNPGDVFQIDTAGMGGDAFGPVCNVACVGGTGGVGGWNGDSDGGRGGDAGGPGLSAGGGGGGGASDVRVGLCATTVTCDLSKQIIVAGGGGGASYGSDGTAGGGGDDTMAVLDLLATSPD